MPAKTKNSNWPPGSVIDYAGNVAPEGWVLCFGQTLSRTREADLFAAIGTLYGAGDGSTTFLVPDCRGRGTAGKDDMGGSAAGRLGAQITATTLGAAGGSETVTLSVSDLPGTVPESLVTNNDGANGGSTAYVTSFSVGGGGQHNNLSPTIIFNKIIKL